MDFKTITTIIFKDKHEYKNVSDEQKDSLFFIFNRFMAKKYPKIAQTMNVKGMDKSICMDIWFNELKNEKYIPKWFWFGSTKRKEPKIKDWKIVMEFHEISFSDLYILCEMFPKEIELEIKRIQTIQKEI